MNNHVNFLNLIEYGTMKIFHGIVANQRVYFTDRFGKVRFGKANALLLFPDHVVLNLGSFGQVVNDENFVKLGRIPQ